MKKEKIYKCEAERLAHKHNTKFSSKFLLITLLTIMVNLIKKGEDVKI